MYHSFICTETSLPTSILTTRMVRSRKELTLRHRKNGSSMHGKQEVRPRWACRSRRRSGGSRGRARAVWSRSGLVDHAAMRLVCLLFSCVVGPHLSICASCAQTQATPQTQTTHLPAQSRGPLILRKSAGEGPLSLPKEQKRGPFFFEWTCRTWQKAKCKKRRRPIFIKQRFSGAHECDVRTRAQGTHDVTTPTTHNKVGALPQSHPGLRGTPLGSRQGHPRYTRCPNREGRQATTRDAQQDTDQSQDKRAFRKQVLTLVNLQKM